MTSALQRKTDAGQSLAADPAPVSSHGFVNVKNDAGVTHPHLHCIRDDSTLQPPARNAAFDALRARAEELMERDAARYGAHWMVWLSLTYAANGWRWEAGDGEVEGVRDE